MRVFIDTNALLSASLFPSGGASRAYNVAVAAPNDAIVTTTTAALSSSPSR